MQAAALEAWGQELVPLPNKTGGMADCRLQSAGSWYPLGAGAEGQPAGREGALCMLVTEQFTSRAGESRSQGLPWLYRAQGQSGMTVRSKDQLRPQPVWAERP